MPHFWRLELLPKGLGAKVNNIHRLDFGVGLLCLVYFEETNHNRLMMVAGMILFRANST